jgi:hypothetical protein
MPSRRLVMALPFLQCVLKKGIIKVISKEKMLVNKFVHSRCAERFTPEIPEQIFGLCR